MSLITADRVRDQTTTTGTGVLTISGTPPVAYRTFGNVCSTGDTFLYVVVSQTLNEWEVGLGTYSGLNQITRTTVFQSSNAGALVSFSAGTKFVILTQTAEQAVLGLVKLSRGVAGGTITLNNLGATADYNFNLPITAGTAGQPLLSGGGGSNNNTFGPLDLANSTGNLLPARLNAGTNASGDTYWRGDGVWAAPYGYINVLAHGVKNTGLLADATTNRTNINAAWALNQRLYFPAGKYFIDGPLTVPNVNNVSLMGDGSFNVNNVAFDGTTWTTGAGTLIVATDLTSNIMDWSNASGVSNITLQGFSLCRNAQATSATAYGIRISQGDAHLVRDVKVYNHGIGIQLGFMGGYAVAENVQAGGNKSHGVQLQGQWQLYNVFSFTNGGDGFRLDNPGALGANSSGQWSRLSTFNNTGWGFNCVPGSFAQRLEGFRISDSFFGNDLTGEMNLDSYAGNAHKFTGTQFEGNDNVNLVVISANNPTIQFTGCYFTCGGTANCINSALNGSRGPSNGPINTLLVDNCAFLGLAGFGHAASGGGVKASGSGARVVISNCQIDGLRNPIQVDNGAGGVGTSQHLNVSNCSIYSMGDLFSGSGVVGIFMQSNNGKCNIQGCEIGASTATGFTTGVLINNSGTPSAGTVTGCGISNNATPVSLTATTTYVAGNY